MQFQSFFLQLFKSYLSQRSQQVNGDVCISEKLPIEIGVPQGFVLGEILFLIYINDLLLIFDNCKCHLYANDTCCARTKLEAEIRLQENNEKVSIWLKNNSLVVNASKTNIMLVGSKSSVGEYILSASLKRNGYKLILQSGGPSGKYTKY